jgi:hypothetical protein
MENAEPTKAEPLKGFMEILLLKAAIIHLICNPILGRLNDPLERH